MFPLSVCAVVFLGADSVRADDPPPAEQGPAPRVIVVSPGAYAPGAPYYYRASAYDVWKYAGVDRFNQFRPRVAISPYGGAYYMYDGSPYPYVPIDSRNFGTTIVGTPYR